MSGGLRRRRDQPGEPLDDPATSTFRQKTNGEFRPIADIPRFDDSGWRRAHRSILTIPDWRASLNVIAIVLLGIALMTDAPAPTADSLPPTALLSIGYVEAKLADFMGTKSYKQRLDDRSGFLAFGADFRGDGKIEQARVLRNMARDVAYVVVVVATREKIDTYVVKSMSLSDADNMGIRAAPPSGPNETAAGITVFALDGTSSETFDLIDDDFVARPGPSRP